MQKSAARSFCASFKQLRTQCRLNSHCAIKHNRLFSSKSYCTTSLPVHKSATKSRLYHESGNKEAVQAHRVAEPSNAETAFVEPQRTRVSVEVDGKRHEFSAILLRDLCECPACVHESSKQRLYSTAEIPARINAHSITASQSRSKAIDIRWNEDISGFSPDHVTTLDEQTLRELMQFGGAITPFSADPSQPTPWDASSSKLPDYNYRSYMEDDATLLQAIEQLQTHGLVFITNVPSIEKSVANIAERIGPIKDTFYGQTWDVQTVPKAINAASTSGDLGFHTDLLYFENPPHIQLLHCIQSSSAGGASVFADAFKCALDLFEQDEDAFNLLAATPVNYHYKHVDSNLYAATKPVIDMRPLRMGDTTYKTLSEFLVAWSRHRQVLKDFAGVDAPTLHAIDCLEKINWGPPFLAPFTLQPSLMKRTSAREALNDKVDAWHAAARKLSSLLEKSENLHERLMKSGECVLFNNTRVLHSRRAFNSEDVGKPRWLRGTYADKDAFFSKLESLVTGSGRVMDLGWYSLVDKFDLSFLTRTYGEDQESKVNRTMPAIVQMCYM